MTAALTGMMSEWAFLTRNRRRARCPRSRAALGRAISGRCQDLPSSRTRGVTACVAGGPAAYGHADAGVLEGQGVTDAVAGHRHDVTMALRRRGNRAFLLRGGPPHALCRPGTRGQPAQVAGKAAGVRRAGRRAAPGTPARAATARPARIVTRDHTRATPWRAEMRMDPGVPRTRPARTIRACGIKTSGSSATGPAPPAALAGHVLPRTGPAGAPGEAGGFRSPRRVSGRLSPRTGTAGKFPRARR